MKGNEGSFKSRAVAADAADAVAAAVDGVAVDAAVELLTAVEAGGSREYHRSKVWRYLSLDATNH